jgi:uncharacterized protein YbcV (DUF1398 family)
MGKRCLEEELSKVVQDQIAVLEECAAASLAGTASFPEIVSRLQSLDLKRYYTDYSRHETTYYLPDGDSHVVAMHHPPQAISEKFSAAGVEAAIRASQRGEFKYTEFLQRTMAAGCVGYFVQIAGRQCLYFGHNGEVHLEPFPSVK